MGAGGAARGGLRRSEEADTPEPEERRAPGLATVLETLVADGRHTVLDLGPAVSDHLSLFGRYAHRIRFVDLVSRLPSELTAEQLESALPAESGPSADVVLAWHALDLLSPAGRSALVRRVTEVTAPGARMYVVLSAPGARLVNPYRSIAVEADRVVHVAGDGAPVHIDPPLPARLERLLEPFAVQRAFMLRSGLREYVVVRD